MSEQEDRLKQHIRILEIQLARAEEGASLGVLHCKLLDSVCAAQHRRIQELESQLREDENS